MRMEWYQRKLAVFLSVILILEPVVQVLPAMAYGKTVMEIEEFEELDESVMVQTVPYGTAYEDLDLPDYLSAQVFEVTAEDEEEDEEVASGSDATSSDASSSAATPANASSSDATVSDASGGEDGYRMIPVTWELSSGPGGLSDYDGETAGTYVFDAVLAAGGYRVGDAILPFIEVEVLEAEPLPVTALLTTNGELIDISNATVVIDGTYTYNGSAQVPSKDNIKVILNGEEINLTNYSIQSSNNVNAGNTAMVSVTAENDDTYTGTAFGSFEIGRAGLTVEGITFNDREYDGTNIVTVKDEGELQGVIGNDDVSMDVTDLTCTVDSANAGIYTNVTLSGLSLTGADADNYTVPEQTVNANVTISPISASNLNISLSRDSYEYDGTAKEPSVVYVSFAGSNVPESAYTVSVSYENNVNAGTAKATATFTGNCSGSVTEDFTIHPKELTVTDATVSDREYDGTNVVEVSEVTLDGVIGTDDVSVDVSGISGELDNADAGTYSSVQLAGLWSLDGNDASNYTVTKPTSAVSTTVTISPKTVSGPTVELSQNTYEYDGTEKKPDVTVTDGTTEISSSEYTVSYANNVEAGTATVTITDVAGGNYTVSESTTTFAITALSLDDAVVTVAGSYTYDGTEQTPLASDIVVSLGETVISSSKYTVSVSDNTNAGTAIVMVTGSGSYSGSATGSFTIAAKAVNSPIITLSQDTYGYDGTAKEPRVTVTDGTTEIPSSEYTVNYTNNVEAGTATVTITDVAGGNYTVSGTADFTIQAKATEEETDSDERESSVQFSDNGRWMSGARGWWYSDHNGDYPKGEWRQLSWLGKTNWYYFDAEGWMVTGWLDWNGKRYHLHTISDGTLGYMYTGWEQIDGVWYYFDESGALLINGMTPDGHRTDENGARVE